MGGGSGLRFLLGLGLLSFAGEGEGHEEGGRFQTVFAIGEGLDEKTRGFEGSW